MGGEGDERRHNHNVSTLSLVHVCIFPHTKGVHLLLVLLLSEETDRTHRRVQSRDPREGHSLELSVI